MHGVRGFRLFGVSRFKDKVAVIAGAEHPLGAALVRRLAGFGAIVVAIGREESYLFALAREMPGQIEPLALRSGRTDVLGLLYEAWGDEPLDLYADLMPLCPSEMTERTGNFVRSAGVGAALLRGMRRSQATGVIAIPAAPPDGGAQDEARAAGYGALLRNLAADCRPGRLVGLALPPQPSVWTEAACLSAGDAILALCHPVTRGLTGGQILDWEPDMPPERNSPGPERG